MGKFVAGRLLQSVIALWVVTLAVFILVRQAGDPTVSLLPLNALPEQREALRERIGLDKSYVEQYFIYMGDLLQADFGESRFLRQDALDTALSKFPATLELAGLSMAVLLVIAVPAGVYSAMNRGTLGDLIVRLIAILGNAFPSFWLGIVFILVFAVWLNWLPPAGRGEPENLVLPVLTLSWYLAGGLMRVVRSSMLEVMGRDYVRTARAKGLSDRAVTWRHVFRNALLPITTYGGIMFLNLLTGTIIVETVFGWPGMGREVITSVTRADYPMVQTIALLLGSIYIFGNMFIDIAYFYIDPRLRRA